MEMRALVSCSAAGKGASDRFRLSNVSPWITSARGASMDRDFPATVKLGSSSMIRDFKGVSIYKNKTRRNVLSQRRFLCHVNMHDAEGKIPGGVHVGSHELGAER
ncbi:unnamed protein product [Brassica rapa subsp. trilocularis]